MARPAAPLAVTPSQSKALRTLVAQRNAPAAVVRRARVILLSSDGVAGTEIANRLGITPQAVVGIRTRFRSTGVEGLPDRPRSGSGNRTPEALVAMIVERAMSAPPRGHSHWSTGMLAKEFDVAKATVHKVLVRNDLKPHQTRTFKISRDPKFAAKATDVVGLYLNPPENAIVLSADEKTQIQALERTQPLLPLWPGRVERRTHDYRRNGVLSLYAALEVRTGRVTGKCTESHTAEDFIGFLDLVVRKYPTGELHIIIDNSSTHSTDDVSVWLAKHPRVHFHFTPTSASWLNQVEGFFGILTRKSVRRGNFPSKRDLRRHIEAFIAMWNRDPTPFVWTKSAHRIVRDHRRLMKRTSHTSY